MKEKYSESTSLLSLGYFGASFNRGPISCERWSDEYSVARDYFVHRVAIEITAMVIAIPPFQAVFTHFSWSQKHKSPIKPQENSRHP